MDDAKQTLRSRAEALLAAGAAQNQKGPPSDADRLIEELRVYQIELEMQNHELRGTQLALDASLGKYADLYDFAPVGYFVCTPNGLIQNANFTGASLVGVERTALMGIPFSRLILREDQDIFYLHRKQILQTEHAQTFELRLVKGDGAPFFVKLNLEFHREADSLLITVTDISCLKGAQRALREARDELETRVTARTLELETLNKKLKEALSEKDRIAEALRVSENRYRSLVESTDDFIYLVNQKGEYLFMNNRTRSLYGFTPEEVPGRWYGEFHDEEETGSFMDRVRLVFRTGGSVHHEHHHKGRYYLLTLSPVKGPDGRVRSVTVVSKEITAQKKLETSLMKSNEALRREQSRRVLLSKRLIDLLEEERARIAGDLHDQVGQQLTSLKMDLEIIPPEFSTGNPEISEKLAGAVHKTSHVLHDIKSIAAGLRPGILNAFGLEQSLGRLLKELEQKSVKTHFFSLEIPLRFNSQKELAIYRIAQESVHNIMKHADARNVHVNLTTITGNICLSVEDDGIGFDPLSCLEFVDGKSSLGLLIMRERAFQAGGELTVESAKGKGTHILAEIPL